MITGCGIFTQATPWAALIAIQDKALVLDWTLEAAETVMGQVIMLRSFANLYMKSRRVISHGNRILANLTN